MEPPTLSANPRTSSRTLLTLRTPNIADLIIGRTTTPVPGGCLGARDQSRARLSTTLRANQDAASSGDRDYRAEGSPRDICQDCLPQATVAWAGFRAARHGGRVGMMARVTDRGAE